MDLTTEVAAERLAPELVGLIGKERAAMYWRAILAGMEPIRAVPQLVELASWWSPDLVVRDDTNFAGCIAAERLGLAHAAVHTVAHRPVLYQLVAGQLDERRSEVGLPPDPDLSMPFRYLFLSSFPPGFVDPGSRCRPRPIACGRARSTVRARRSSRRGSPNWDTPRWSSSVWARS